MSAALYPQQVSDDFYDQIATDRWPAIGARRSAPAITAVPPLPQVEYVTTQGPWEFTRQTTMDARLIAEFYDLYSLAFEPLKKRSVARQVLTEAEFTEQMLDERVVKYVARGERGEALGLTTLTNELDSVPWVSPDYFIEHYPEHSARNAVYYLGFTLAHPSQRHLRFVETHHHGRSAEPGPRACRGRLRRVRLQQPGRSSSTSGSPVLCVIFRGEVRTSRHPVLLLRHVQPELESDRYGSAHGRGPSTHCRHHRR